MSEKTMHKYSMAAVGGRRCVLWITRHVELSDMLLHTGIHYGLKYEDSAHASSHVLITHCPTQLSWSNNQVSDNQPFQLFNESHTPCQNSRQLLLADILCKWSVRGSSRARAVDLEVLPCSRSNW